jgi:hypothetical protein
MKSTLELSNFLFLKKIQYCKQIGFKEYPIIVTNVKDLPDKSLKLSVHATMRYDKECLGVWYPSCGHKPGLIYIDIARHKNKRQLENTLIHELLHDKLGPLHDKKFFDTIKQVKKGAKL